MSRESQIEKLKADLAAGRVVTIVGTGVSVAACGNQEVDGHKVATWGGLLAHGLQHCRLIGAADEDDEEILSMQLRKGKTDILINAAETIAQRLHQKSPGTFRGWLKDTVGKLELKPGNQDLAAAVAALPGVLATLNYDHLLESVSGRHAVTWTKHDDVQDVLTGKVTDAVLHLHGSYKEPESVVLGLSSYLAVKDQPHAKAVLNLFTIDRTLLFVGCGDTVLDPNFTRLIEWGKEALKEVAPRHWLLCRESEIPDFQKKLADAPWLQPLSYGKEYHELPPFVRGLIPPPGTRPKPTPSPVPPLLNLDCYRDAMRRHYGHLKLEQLDASTHDVPRALMLTRMFIPQSARECAEFMPRVFELPKELQRRLRDEGQLEGQELDEEMLARHQRDYISQAPTPVLEIAADPECGRLVVLGDPGSGKSSLLQYLLLLWAEDTASGSSDKPLPVLIELRDFARLRQERQTDHLLDYLHNGSSVRFHLDRAQLENWLMSRPSVVLFDGLDEIFDPVLRGEISTAIHRFADSYPLCRIIVTSRIIGYQHQTWRDEKFRQVMLQDLDGNQMDDFLGRWHGTAYEDPEKGRARQALLARAIRDSPAIRQLAGNPLLLTMMAILNRTQELPRNRARLYEKCSELLLHQWKAEEALQADPDLKEGRLDFADKRTLLLRVAHSLQTSPSGLAGNLISEARLETTLTEGLRSIPGLRPERAARALITQLRGRNFMLSSVGGQSYAFVHRTFLEYFCALEIRERFETTQTLSLEELKTGIFGHWPEEIWHEVLCLLAGMLAPRFVRKVLEWLLDQNKSELDHHCIFLAARCVGEVRDRGELAPIENRVLTLTRSLCHFDLPYSYPSFSREDILVFTIQRRAIRTISMIWNGSQETLKWLLSLISSEQNSSVRCGALQELARRWKEYPETHQLLLTVSKSDPDTQMRRTAVRELAQQWKDHPDTHSWLISIITSDSNEHARSVAIEQLARGWTDHHHTHPLLLSIISSEKKYQPRQIAVREIAGRWSKHPATHPLLLSLISNDKSSHVRLAAILELAERWRDEPNTHGLLVNLASSDPSLFVRRRTIRILARDWKNDPSTLPLLLSFTTPETIEELQLSSAQELAYGWKTHTVTKPLLISLASTDRNYKVRCEAIRELARGWKNEPGTLSMLRSLVLNDLSSSVRIAAARELSYGWKDAPDTRKLLVSSVSSDQSSFVRRRVADVLARGWGNDEEVLALLEAVNAEQNSHS